MPAPPRRQLAIVILTEDAAVLAERLVTAGFLTIVPSPDLGRGQARQLIPGPRELARGGFLKASVVAHDEEQFLSSGQGGFRVYCPTAGGPGSEPTRASNTTGAFSRALTRWRAGGPREIACGCGTVHDLADLLFRPACGFARQWIELHDVGSAELSPASADALEGATILLRRG